MGKNAKTTNFIFFIGDEGAILVEMAGKTIKKRLFTPSFEAEKTQQLFDLLKEAPKAKVSVLLDILDQSYQIQNFPPVSRFSVEKLVKKRMERDLAPEDIKNYLSLGRQSQGRNDWRYLLISVSNSPQIMQWLDTILEMGNRFTGIFLVPIESENLIKTIIKNSDEKLRTDWQMLILYNKTGGFRQTVTYKNRIQFTRLTQATNQTSPEIIAGSIEQESRNTMEYLKRLSFKQGDEITMHTVASQEIIDSISADNTGFTHLQLMTPENLAEKIKLKASDFESDHYADAVFSVFFATARKSMLKFSTPASKIIAKYQGLLSALKIATWLIAISLVGIAAYFFYSWSASQDDFSALERKIKSKVQELQSIEEQAKIVPEDIDRMTDMVDIYQTFSGGEQTPPDFIRQLAKMQIQGVVFNKINWRSDQKFETRAKQEYAPLFIEASVEFYNPVVSSEKRIEQINQFTAELRTIFADFTITHNQIPGTFGEDENFSIDFDNDRSAILLQPIKLDYKIYSKQPAAEVQ